MNWELDYLYSEKYFSHGDISVNDNQNISEIRLGNGKIDSRTFPKPETFIKRHSNTRHHAKNKNKIKRNNLKKI